MTDSISPGPLEFGAIVLLNNESEPRCSIKIVLAGGPLGSVEVALKVAENVEFLALFNKAIKGFIFEEGLLAGTDVGAAEPEELFEVVEVVDEVDCALV